MELQRLYDILVTIREYLFVNLFFTIVFFAVTLFIFSFINYSLMERNGFNKENTLDTTLLSLLFIAAPSIINYFFNKNTDFFTFLKNDGHFYSILLAIFFIYIKSKFSNWSFFKLLDIYGVSLSILNSLTFLFVSIYFLDHLFFIVSLTYFLFYKKFQRYIMGTSIDFFMFFKIKKHETLSFIGGTGLLFIIYSLLLEVLLYVYNFKVVNWSLILLLILFIIFFVKRSHKNLTLWIFRPSLLLKQNKNLNKN